MSEPGHEENEDIERGYAEENSGAPVDDVEREVSKPPEERWSGHGSDDAGSGD